MGSNTNNLSPNEAGAIHCTDETNLILNYCILEGNYAGASDGALAFGVSSTGTINNTEIRNNTAVSKGGGIACYNNCSPVLDFVNLIENIAVLELIAPYVSAGLLRIYKADEKRREASQIV